MQQDDVSLELAGTSFPRACQHQLRAGPNGPSKADWQADLLDSQFEQISCTAL